jgi:hypothetical protein
MKNTRYKVSYHVVGKKDFDIIVKTDETHMGNIRVDFAKEGAQATT